MSSRRDEMLREMGLWPTWRLRGEGESSRATNHESRVAEALPHPSHRARGEGAPSPVTNHESPGTEALSFSDSTAPVPQAREAAVKLPPASRLPPPAPSDDRRASIMRMEWPELKATVAACRACALHARRTNTVFGVGDENAEWVFVGEGPGADEDALGDPFVGQAGKLLDNMLAAIQLERGRNVYICNVVKCRPPGNRNPEPEEMLKCDPFLQRQIELIRPKLIVALGRIAAQNLLARDASIASLRGRVHEYKGVPLIVTYHPAYLLRSLPEKAKAWEDLCFAVATMQRLQSGTVTPT